MTHLIAGDWNVHHGTTFKQAKNNFDDMLHLGAQLLILQEVKPKGKILDGLRREYGFGFRYAEPEFAIAWDRRRFKFVRASSPTMSPTEYWTINRALIVVLADKLNGGRHVKLMSYHPPAHVQSPKHVTHDKVMRVHREFAAKRYRIATRAEMPFLSAGDSNIDPRQGWAPKGGWGFEFNRKPLKYFRAPAPTFGKRHIDEFIGKRFRRSGPGHVLKYGPSDHRPFVLKVRYV